MNSGTQDLPDSALEPPSPKGVVQFGNFEVNLQTGELRKNGERVRLQGRPFQILQALLERPGEVVTREELRKRLWPVDTFVDFESGLNTAANRLRLTLGDSAENPLYIQTLSRTGYRFIAPVCEGTTETAAEPAAEPAPAPQVVTPAPAPPNAVKRWPIWAGAACCAILLAGVMYLTRGNPHAPATFRQITFRRGSVDQARFVAGGQTVLYSAHWNGEPSGIYMVAPGTPESRSMGFRDFALVSASRSGELILSQKRSLYRVPMNGGAPKLFMEGVAAAEWTQKNDFALVRNDAGQASVEFPRGRTVFQTAGYISALRVSPNGDAVAFLEHPMATDDGGNVIWIDLAGVVHRVSEGWASEQGLAWWPDGREIWFTASRTGLNRSLYATSRSGSVRLVASIPGIMTLDDISPQGQVVLSRDTLREVMLQGKIGDRPDQEPEQEKDISWFDWSLPHDISYDGRYLLFTEGGEAGGREYAVYIRDLESGATTRLSDGEGMAIFPDSKSVLTMLPRDNNHLNVVPVGAGQPRSIESGVKGFVYQWAQIFPDGRKLLVNGNVAGQALRMYTQPVDGGLLTALNPAVTLEMPRISPDGTRIAGLTQNHKVAVIPASGGAPQVLPIDGMTLPVKWSNDSSRLLVRMKEQDGSLWLEWVELKSGKITRWHKLRAPEEGNESAGVILVSRDEKTYVSSVERQLSELFVVDGWS